MTQVRPAILADAAAIAQIDVECWRTTYAGILPDRFLIGLSESERRRAWAADMTRRPGELLVASDSDGRVLGFGSAGRARGTDHRFHGEVYTLYVAPDHQGKGIGRALLIALFGRLQRRAIDSAMITVLRANPSRFFYERLGGKLAGQRSLTVAGTEVAAATYGWPDLAASLKAHSKSDGRLSGG